MAENQVADTEYFTAEHATGDPHAHKLDARTRSEAVERARALGLLAPPVPHVSYGHARGLRH